MLGILFTVVFGYFYTYTSVMKTYYANVGQVEQEQFIVTGQLGTNGNVSLYVNNTGPIAIQIVAVMVLNGTTGQVIKLDNSTGGSNPKLPIALNAGQNSKVIDTGLLAKQTAAGSYLIKAVTQKGNTRIALFPQPQTSSDLAYQALTSGALGDIYLSFGSYTYYQITSCNSSSGYCLITPGSSAFTVPSSLSYMAFSITMTDLNPVKDSIVLDQFTLIYQNSFYGDQNLRVNLIPWYIVSNQSNKLLNTYTPVILNYSVPTTIVFAGTTCITAAVGPNFGGGACNTLKNAGIQTPNMNPGTISTVFIMTHGWEISPPISWTQLSYSNANYGQNLPYVSTLYT